MHVYRSHPSFVRLLVVRSIGFRTFRMSSCRAFQTARSEFKVPARARPRARVPGRRTCKVYVSCHTACRCAVRRSVPTAPVQPVRVGDVPSRRTCVGLSVVGCDRPAGRRREGCPVHGPSCSIGGSTTRTGLEAGSCIVVRYCSQHNPIFRLSAVQFVRSSPPEPWRRRLWR